MQCDADTKKSQGKFGTMIIQLPSDYSGGQLTVTYESLRKKFKFGDPTSLFNFKYAAFYADCKCEMKPVSKGYCLCLVYDLVCGSTDICPIPDHPENRKVVSTIVRCIRKWNADDSDGIRPLLCHMLCDKYSKAGGDLSFQTLKGVDEAVGKVLVQAQKAVEFDLYVANMCIESKWLAVDNEDYLHDIDRWKDRYEEIDLIGDSVKALNLRSVDNECIDMVEINSNLYDEVEVCSENDPDDVEVSDSDEVTLFDKPMYNYVQKYYSASFLLWPRKYRLKNLGMKNMINLLSKDIQNVGPSSEIEARAKELMQKSVLEEYDEVMTDEVYVLLLQSLLALDKLDLILEFFDTIVSSASRHLRLIESSLFIQEFIAVAKKYGWGTLGPSLLTIFDKVISADRSAGDKCCKFIYILSQQPSSQDHSEVCQKLAGVPMRMLLEQEEIKKRQQPCHIQLHSQTPRPFCPGKEFLVHLLQSLDNVQGLEQLASLIQDIARKPANYSLNFTLLPVCKELHKLKMEGEGSGKALQLLLSHCISAWEKEASRVDWSKFYHFNCLCEHCYKLSDFLRSQTESRGLFDVDDQVKKHLLGNLRSHDCLSAVSVDVSKPQTLLVTKNDAKIGLSEWEEKNLSRLMSLRET